MKWSLRAARVNAEMTLDEVASQIHRTKGTIIKWEKGKAIPSASDFMQLCKLYECDPNVIFLPQKLALSESKRK